MSLIRIGICIPDQEYLERFERFIIRYYSKQFEPAVYSGPDQIREAAEQAVRPKALILSDCPDRLEGCREYALKEKIPLIYLTGAGEKREIPADRMDGVYPLDKYQDAGKILETVRSLVEEKPETVAAEGRAAENSRIYAIYSLTAASLQLPFAIVLARILGEKHKVLLVDLQEDSGIGQLCKAGDQPGLDELLVMAAGGRFYSRRMGECILHEDSFDLVYPAANTESLVEVEAESYLKLLDSLTAAFGYEMILVNLGSRFPGFFGFAGSCREFFFLQARGMAGVWRESEFIEEAGRRGLEGFEHSMRKVALSLPAGQNLSCQKLADYWQWNEPGSYIRRMVEPG